MSRRGLSVVMMSLIVLMTGLSGYGRTTQGTGTVLARFLDPDVHAKPMARMWFPDAGAGEDNGDYIDKQISELAEKGFGGVEVAMLMSRGVHYDNPEAQAYGWGTDNWIKLLKKVLKAAAKVPDGFQIDMTVTAHWPPVLNTFDPNDDAANKELSFSVTPITPDDLARGTIKLELPLQRTDAPSSTFGPTAYDHFLFTDQFVSAVVVRIADVVEKPGTNSPFYVFDFKSLTPITERVSVIPGAGYAAGVPDRQTAQARGWNYDKLCDFFGPESDGPWTLYNGKQDERQNRKRMADWQDEYQASLEGVTIDLPEGGGQLKPGEWVVLSTFYRGTGQSIVGSTIMPNGVFAAGYFNAAGTKALTDYWMQMFEKDPELLNLMKALHGNYFEDSIESTSVSSYWSPTFMDDVDEQYAYRDIMPTVAASKYVSSGFMDVTVTNYFSFTGDDGLVEQIYEDYSDKLAELYVKYRVSGLADWAKDTMGWGFRGQTFHLPGMEIGKAAMVADVPECDNNAKGDGIRYMAGTVNITGRDVLSMEAMTGPTIGYANMGDLLTELGQNYSDGVTRAVLHGTPYTKTFNGYCSEWPGWLPFGGGSYGSSFTYREAYWPDFVTETGFMSRTQAVLQNGQAKIDLAVLIDKESSFDFECGNRFQKLLDSGYSYNIISESLLSHPCALVSDDVLAPEGPAYKALIVDQVHALSPAGMKRLADYAKAGLPIILYDSAINGLQNVRMADTEEDLLEALNALGINGYAKYDVPRLETTMYQDVTDGTNYYYLFNNAYPENAAMMDNAQGDYYKGIEKVLQNITVTLEGVGVPYRLDPYTGQVAQMADYTAGNGTVTFTIDRMSGGTAMIYAVTSNTADFDNVAGKKIVSVKEEDAIDLSGESWNLILHSYGPAPDSRDPGDSQITDVDFGLLSLGKWSDIQATKEQLDKLGVRDMKYVSGTGEYTITFATPENWDNYDGAIIEYGYGRDQVGAVIVNGTELPANNASDRVDVGTLLKMGENTITIRLHSTLYGRTYAEHSGYQDQGVEYGMGKGIMSPSDPDAYFNGLLRVRVVPYKKKEGGTGTDLRSPALPTANDTDDTNTNPDGTWFDLQGRKFTGKPTQKGVYINNGKKRLKEGKR